MISPETFDRLTSRTDPPRVSNIVSHGFKSYGSAGNSDTPRDQVGITKSTIPNFNRRSPSSEESDWKDVLLTLPINYRKNTRIILIYLSKLPDEIFRVVPGTMEISLDSGVIRRSNFLELLYSLHNNLQKQYPIGMGEFLYLLAQATRLPAFTIQNVRLRNVLLSIRDRL